MAKVVKINVTDAANKLVASGMHVEGVFYYNSFREFVARLIGRSVPDIIPLSIKLSSLGRPLFPFSEITIEGNEVHFQVSTRDDKTVKAIKNHQVIGKMMYDEEDMLELIHRDWFLFTKASESLKNNVDFVLRAISIDGIIITFLGVELREDRDFVLKAVRCNWTVLSHLKTFLDDVEIVAAAVRKCPPQHTLRFLDAKYCLLNWPFVQKLVRAAPEAFDLSPDDVADQRQVNGAVSKLCESLMRQIEGENNLDFIKEVVASHPGCFRYASEEARGDFDIAHLAVRSDGRNFVHASSQLQKDLRIIKAAIYFGDLHLKDVSVNFHTSSLVTCAVGINGMELEHAADAFKDDCAIVRVAVQTSSLSIRHAKSSVWTDHSEIVREAFVADPRGIMRVAENLPVLKACIVTNILPACGASLSVMMAVVAVDGMLLRVASQELREDRPLVLAAVRRTPSALQYASLPLRRDPAMVRLALIGARRSVIRAAAPEIRVLFSRGLGLKRNVAA